MTMLEDPDRAAEFLSMNCADGIVEDPLSTLYYSLYINIYDVDAWSSDERRRVIMCLGPTSLAQTEELERCDSRASSFSVGQTLNILCSSLKCFARKMDPSLAGQVVKS